ncbi:MAG TPA: NAD-dependent epimerase/dehydratase family protein, partial [Solirubrobacteraceae bacterium]|nr:NAD-dependent epimerase/dehydratase family protein [Solirubrobacteraceae bacterium]
MSERPAPHEERARERCLVTGATGFIGAHLAARLVHEGYPVRCLARARSGTASLAKLDVQIVRGDLTDAPSLARAAAGCRHVLHCAALVSDWATRKEVTAANVAGTRSLLDACADTSVARFVHFSTTDVYGHPGGANVDETHARTRFANWYAQTKLDAEAEVHQVRLAGGLDAVILRPATVYGPGSKDVIGEIARAILGGRMVL